MFSSLITGRTLAQHASRLRAVRYVALLTALLGGLSLAGCSSTAKDEVVPATVPSTLAAAPSTLAAAPGALATATNFDAARGVNIQFSYYPDRFEQIDWARIKREGFNAVRIEVDPARVDVTSTNPNLIGFGRVLRFVREANAAGLGVVLTYHSGQAGYYGGDTANDYAGREAGQWWAQAIPKLENNGANSDYTINIINEWGKDTRKAANAGFGTIWAQNYSDAITSIHNAGYRGQIIIDASSFGADTKVLLEHGKEIATKGHLIVFSLHIYPNSFGGDNDTAFNAYKAEIVKLNEMFDNSDNAYRMIIGEFGSKYKSGSSVVDSKTRVQGLVQNAIGKGWGTFGWSWLGDSVSGDINNVNNNMNALDSPSYLQWLKTVMGL